MLKSTKSPIHTARSNRENQEPWSIPPGGIVLRSEHSLCCTPRALDRAYSASRTGPDDVLQYWRQTNRSSRQLRGKFQCCPPLLLWGARGRLSHSSPLCLLSSRFSRKSRPRNSEGDP